MDITGPVSIAGTLTYEDVTSIDSVGLITARKGIISSGVVTATAFHGSSQVEYNLVVFRLVLESHNLILLELVIHLQSMVQQLISVFKVVEVVVRLPHQSQVFKLLQY